MSDGAWSIYHYFPHVEMRLPFNSCVFFALLMLVQSCASEDAILNQLLSEFPVLGEVSANQEEYEVQVLYVQIDRDSENRPTFKHYAYGGDNTQYFYPASTVKMPVAVLSLDKLNRLNIPNLDRNSRMQVDSMRYPQSTVLLDTTSSTGLPSIGHYIHKIFVVSDNDAYNRLYEFVGQNAINDRLVELGIGNTRIIHRLSDARFGPEENRYTNPVTFFNADTIVYGQAEQFADAMTFVSPDNQIKGVAYLDVEGELINEPFDFSRKNFYPLNDQIEVLKRVVFPEVYPLEQQFDLDSEDIDFLLRQMSMMPFESEYPKYEGDEYYDGYVKFFMFGDTKARIPKSIRIFNKVGWAYGYLTDCAYIVDFERNIEFMLAATIHANANSTYNDGVYEEDEVAIPFLAELGRQVYAYELQRQRQHEPDLSRFKLDDRDE